ncbi:MAG: chemotaxis protein CheW [Spirochaetota bacterium]
MNNELLNIAAKTAESVIDEADSLDILQLVSFKLDEIEYGIDILSVHEILRIPEITRLPNTPEYIKGVINLRGNVIPVVDIRLRFGMQQVTLTELSRIIVVEIGEKLVGLLVDNVHQVIRLSRSRIDEPHDLIEGISTEFISGIGRLQDRLIVILRLDNILFSDEQ